MPRIKRLSLWVGLTLLPAFACALPTNQPQSLPTPHSTSTPPSAPINGTAAQLPALSPPERPFAPYIQPTVVSRQIKNELSFDPEALQNPFLLERLNGEQRQIVQEQGFVVVAEPWDDLIALYQRAAANGDPVFISSDAILYLTALTLGIVQQQTESIFLSADLQSLNHSMVAVSETQLAAAIASGDAAIQEAAFRNVAFFSVGAALVQPDFPIPNLAADLVNEELTLIQNHAGIFLSPLTGSSHDYGVYQLPAAIAANPALAHYKLAQLWYQRPLFQPEYNNPEARLGARQSLLALIALKQTQNFSRWQRLTAVSRYFHGAAGVLTMWHVQEAAQASFGAIPTVEKLANQQRIDDFIATIRQFPFDSWRWLPPPQRADAGILSELANRQLSPFTGDETVSPITMIQVGGAQQRGLPHPFDLAAAFGSETAIEWLAANEESAYAGYDSALQKIQEETAARSIDAQTIDLSSGWQYAIQPLLAATPKTAPPFMNSEQWRSRQLQAWSAGWGLRLWQPSPATTAAAGISPIPVSRQLGYVEPQPILYARLAGVVRQTAIGLDRANLIQPQLADQLTQLEAFLLFLKEMSEKENRGVKRMSAAEYERIVYFGELASQLTTIDSLRYAQMPAAATVAHSPDSGFVGQIGVGEALPIYLIVSIEGQPTLALGGILPVYYWKLPATDILSLDEWATNQTRPAPIP